MSIKTAVVCGGSSVEHEVSVITAMQAAAALDRNKYTPGYHFHGHVHMNYGTGNQRVITYNGTTIVNAYERYVISIPDRPVPEKKKNRLIWISEPPRYD